MKEINSDIPYQNIYAKVILENQLGTKKMGSEPFIQKEIIVIWYK